jgi:hypothetical protein
METDTLTLRVSSKVPLPDLSERNQSATAAQSTSGSRCSTCSTSVMPSFWSPSRAFADIASIHPMASGTDNWRYSELPRVRLA